jgi:hypothetical protein
MHRSIAVAAVALLLLVGGCAGMAGVAAPETATALAKARTVGVISVAGRRFTLQKVGIMVFGNELNEVPIGSWGLDDAVAGRVSTVLAKRFTVRRIGVPAGLGWDSEAAVQASVRKLAASAKCDLYIVVTGAVAPFGGTNQYVGGIGMVEYGGAINPDNVTLFAVTAVHLYDGRTFERLLWQRPGFAIGGSIGNVVNAPHRRLDRTWWPATPQGVNNEKYKAAVRALLVDSIGATVPEVMGMTKQAKAN